MGRWWGWSRKEGVFGFTPHATAEEVSNGIDASHFTILVTGASSGIGYETARVLALRGARVIMAVRNMEAGEKAKQSILKEISGADLLLLKLDLSSMRSVYDFCDAFNSMNFPLNILINNAGVMGCPFELSIDGIEMQFATNYVGPFLLTKLLLPTMIKTSEEFQVEGRIINVASNAHYFAFIGGFQLESINDKKSHYTYLAYAKSKLANILHANELSRCLKEKGVNVTVNSINPGIIVTPILRHYHLLATISTHLERLLSTFVFKTVHQGAATQCLVALHPAVKGLSGKYFDNCTFSECTNRAKDPVLSRNLWDLTEDFLRHLRL